MKKLILIASALLVAQMSFGQLFQVGLKGGINSSKVKFDDFNADIAVDYSNLAGSTINNVSFESGDREMGYHVGGFAQLQMILFYIQPELIFSSTGSKINIEDPINGVKTTATITHNTLDVPIIVGWKFWPVHFGLGPVASFNISSESDVSDIYKDFVDDYSSITQVATFGGQVGVGLDVLDTIILDVRYEFGLSKLGKKVTVAGTDFGTDKRQNQFIASVGIMF